MVNIVTWPEGFDSLLIVDYKLHSIACCIDSLPRYHIAGYPGTTLRLTIRYRVLYLRQATPYTGRSQSVRWLLLNMMLQTINPSGTGCTSLRQATHYIGHTQSLRWLLLSNTWGSTLGSGLWWESVERAPTFATQHRQQTPEASLTMAFIDSYP